MSGAVLGKYAPYLHYLAEYLAAVKPEAVNITELQSLRERAVYLLYLMNMEEDL